jgi:hypothetical protein
MTRQWQLMRVARTFLEASKIANNALTGLYFLQISKDKGLNREDEVRFKDNLVKGVDLLKGILQTLKAQERGGKLPSEALLVIRSISRGYFTIRPDQLKLKVSKAIKELEAFKDGKETELETAERVLEIIARSTAEELSTASLRMREVMEARL